MAVIQPGQRIVFGGPAVFQLALVFHGDVARAAAVAKKRAISIELGRGGHQPPYRRTGGVAPGKAHGQIRQPRPRAKLEAERAAAAAFIAFAINLEQGNERLADQIGNRPAKAFPGAVRKIGKPPFGIERPQPAERRFFKVVQQGEAVDPGACIIKPGPTRPQKPAARSAAKAFQDTFHHANSRTMGLIPARWANP